MRAGKFTSLRRGQCSGLDQPRLVHREEGRCVCRQYAVWLHDGTEASTKAPHVIGKNPFGSSQIGYRQKQVAVDVA